MKKLQFDYYDHPTFDYADFSKSVYFNKIGFHKLKAEFGTYLRLGGSVATFIGAQEASLLDSELFAAPEPVEAIATLATPSFGISEGALLAALAIAQKPELAPQLLALRQTDKN